jgi:hypothetical protein
MGAFHLPEIPEILLENQMEHVNFWNAVSKIPDSLSRLSTSFEIFTFHQNISQPTLLLSKSFLSKNCHQNQNGVFSTISVPRVWIYFAEC